METLKENIISRDYKFLDITKEINILNYKKYFNPDQGIVYAICRNRETEFVFDSKTSDKCKINICLISYPENLNYICVVDELTDCEKKTLDTLLNDEAKICDICKKESEENAICYICLMKICKKCDDKVTKCPKCSKNDLLINTYKSYG